MWWNYSSILEPPRYNRGKLGMDRYFHPTRYNECNYLSMLGLKLNPVSKMGSSCCLTTNGGLFILQTFPSNVRLIFAWKLPNEMNDKILPLKIISKKSQAFTIGLSVEYIYRYIFSSSFHIYRAISDLYSSLFTRLGHIISAKNFRHISGVLCQKQVSRAGTGNYISQILWDAITWHCP